MKKLLIFIYCYFSMLGLWAQKYRDAKDSIIFLQLRKLAIADVSKDFTFEKSFELEIPKICRVYQPNRVSVILHKGFVYEIIAKNLDKQETNILITIFDNKYKELAKNYHKGHFYEKIKFQCTTTNIYYLYFSFEKNKYEDGDIYSYKGAAALSFRMD